jgi:hypothetical protein
MNADYEYSTKQVLIHLKTKCQSIITDHRESVIKKMPYDHLNRCRKVLVKNHHIFSVKNGNG